MIEYIDHVLGYMISLNGNDDERKDWHGTKKPRDRTIQSNPIGHGEEEISNFREIKSWWGAAKKKGKRENP